VTQCYLQVDLRESSVASFRTPTSLQATATLLGWVRIGPLAEFSSEQLDDRFQPRADICLTTMAVCSIGPFREFTPPHRETANAAYAELPVMNSTASLCLPSQWWAAARRTRKLFIITAS
jgi:hypothetical protein